MQCPYPLKGMDGLHQSRECQRTESARRFIAEPNRSVRQRRLRVSHFERSGDDLARLQPHFWE